ncbi:MAG: rhodanese-like domain-containing protein, partial [Cyanobacteria bacterium J06626_26]
QKPVVVFADPPGGWGEDGRIVWMLRTLGHSQVVMVDGGFDALVAAGVSGQQGKHVPTPGDFVVDRNGTWEIQRDELKQQLTQDNLVVIDTREAREFAGKTPYGEQRGGHVPGAIHLYFKEFLRQDGTLLPVSEIREKLSGAGITPETQVVVYCTGGIRSGWLAAVLVTLGYQVKNYAGSMWEWSAAPATGYPLEML